MAYNFVLVHLPFMVITCKVGIAVSCVWHAYAKNFDINAMYNGCVAHICNVAAIFVQRHIKYVYSDMGIEIWFTCVTRVWFFRQ